MTEPKEMTLEEALKMNGVLKAQIEQSAAVHEDQKFTNQAVSEEYSKALQEKVTLIKERLAAQSEVQKLKQENAGLQKTNDALIAAENEREQAKKEPDDGKVVNVPKAVGM